MNPGSPSSPELSESTAPATSESGGSRPSIWKNPFVIAFVVGALVLTILPFLQRQTLRAPEPISHLGAWTLVDEQGKPFGSDDLKGKVWIASFFFTRCPSICPKQQQALLDLLPHVEDLQRREGTAPISLVSFTVDPDHDVPEKLLAYQQKLRAHVSAPGEWKLLTGDRAALSELLVKRFLVEMGDKQPVQGTPDLFDISHAGRFVLVDQNGDVRGFWRIDDVSRGNLINAARLLAKEGPRP